MQVLTRGFYCIAFFKSFLKRPVVLDAVWGFPELHDLVKKEENIVELFYTASRRGGGVVVHSKLLYREDPSPKMHLLARLGLFTYRDDRFLYPFIYFN